MTLNRDNVRELFNIINKMPTDDVKKRFSFSIEGGNEEVSSGDIDEFLKAKWPTNIDKIRFRVYSYETSDEIELRLNNDLFGARSIEITSNNLDWVAARTKELEDFINDHRNFHWIFYFPFAWVIFVAILFPLLILIFLVFKLEVATATGFGGALGWLCIFFLTPIARVFPFTYIDSNRPSTRKLLRKFLCWIIPALFVGLLGSTIFALVTHNFS